jgi:hypothetical protein
MTRPEDADGPLGFGDGEEQAPPPRPSEPEPEPEPQPEPDEPPVSGPDRGPREPQRELIGSSGGSRQGWIVGIFAVLVLLYIGLNTLRNHEDSPGSKGPTIGSQARAFAAPLAVGRLEGAVNVATKQGPGDAGHVPACSVHLAGAYNVCDDWAKGPVAVVFFAEPVGGCVRELDTVQRVAARHPEVKVVGVAIRGKRSDVADMVRDRGLTFPIVFDEDGRLANHYSVAVCPQITYLRKGGRVAGTNIGSLADEELDAQLRALIAGRRVVVAT